MTPTLEEMRYYACQNLIKAGNNLRQLAAGGKEITLNDGNWYNDALKHWDDINRCYHAKRRP